MSDADDMVTWLRAQMDEDEQWALAASAPYEHAADGTITPPGGVHWQWVVGENWDPVVPDPALDEFVADGDPVWLASRETWPTRHDWQLPARAANEPTQEMRAAAAGHIVRHDPAAVLADIAAKRQIIGMYEAMQAGVEASEGTVLAGAAKVRLGAYGNVLCAFASAYAERPGYREACASSPLYTRQSHEPGPQAER